MIDRTLVCFGGLVGSGKSVFSKRFASIVGGITIEADLVRKVMWGINPHDRLPESAYKPDAKITTIDVLNEMLDLASKVFETEKISILDMTFASSKHINLIRKYVKKNKVNFAGYWCKCYDRDLQLERVENRFKTCCTSDADVNVARNMLDSHSNIAPIGWTTVDTTKNMFELDDKEFFRGYFFRDKTDYYTRLLDSYAKLCKK